MSHIKKLQVYIIVNTTREIFHAVFLIYPQGRGTMRQLLIVGFISMLLLGCNSNNEENTLSVKPKLTTQTLKSQSVIKDGFKVMTIKEDSEEVLNADTFTLVSANNPTPEKLLVKGKLTIKNIQ
jgi:hypothetical protein